MRIFSRLACEPGIRLPPAIKMFPANNSHDEKLRRIGRLLINMAKDGLLTKSPNGKKWIISQKGEEEFGA